MKLKTLLFIGVLATLTSIIFFSCKEEKDDDLLTGKWVEKDIQSDTLIEDCVKKSYIEFSEYVLDIRKRVFSFNNICDTVERVIGNYTIVGDVLTIKDTMNVTYEYTIDYINSDSMRIKQPNVLGGFVYSRYLRVKE
jgi:hypothetical protein